jgi:hypothetical protein
MDVSQTSIDDRTAALYYPETRGGCRIPPNSTDSSYLDPHQYQLPFPCPPIFQQQYEHGTMVPSSGGGAQRHVSFHHPESTTFYHPYRIPMPPAPHSMYDYPPAHQFHRRHEPSNDARTMSSHVNILTEQPQLGPSSHYIGNSGRTQHLSIDYLNHQENFIACHRPSPSIKWRRHHFILQFSRGKQNIVSSSLEIENKRVYKHKKQLGERGNK